MSEHDQETVYCPTQDAELPPPIPRDEYDSIPIPPVIEADTQDLKHRKALASLEARVANLLRDSWLSRLECELLENKLKFHKFWHFTWMIVAWVLTAFILLSN